MWYVEGGKINFNHTGLVANEYGWWYVEGGKINFNYTGSAANEYGLWKRENGRLILIEVQSPIEINVPRRRMRYRGKGLV